MDASLISPLRGFALQAHELYKEFLHAGFSEEQALYLVIGFTARTE
jgi:hypothetical protein